MTAELQGNAGIDPSRDRFLVGYIAAVKDLLLVELDDVKEA
jgi:hypothetical protein